MDVKSNPAKHEPTRARLYTGDAKVRLMNVAPTGPNAVEFASCMGPLFVMFLAKNSTYMLIQSSVTILHFMLVAAHQVRIVAMTTVPSTWALSRP